MLLFAAAPALAQTSKQNGYSETSSSDFRARAGITLEYKPCNSLTLSLGEELRAMQSLRSFDRAMTSLGVEWGAFKHFDVGVGYTLINALKTPSDAAPYMGGPRHRAYVNAEYTLPLGNFRLSLRERVQCTWRTDSVNVAEKANPSLVLRSRLKLSYKCVRAPLVPYAYFELYNTLNAPYVSLDGLSGAASGASLQNYVCRYRAGAGLKYRFNRHTSLSAYYTFDDDINYDVNITRGKGKVNRVVRETQLRHIIGVELTHRF